MLRLFDMDIPLPYKCMSTISGNCLSICQEELYQFLSIRRNCLSICDIKTTWKQSISCGEHIWLSGSMQRQRVRGHGFESQRALLFCKIIPPDSARFRQIPPDPSADAGVAGSIPILL